MLSHSSLAVYSLKRVMLLQHNIREVGSALTVRHLQAIYKSESECRAGKHPTRNTARHSDLLCLKVWLWMFSWHNIQLVIQNNKSESEDWSGTTFSSIFSSTFRIHRANVELATFSSPFITMIECDSISCKFDTSLIWQQVEIVSIFIFLIDFD